MLRNIRKIMSSIQTFAQAGLNSQAANLINTVKASFEPPQNFKEKIAPLPPHFLAMMKDLYQSAMYEVCDGAIEGKDKEKLIDTLEKKFVERAKAPMAVLPDTGSILECLRECLSDHYDDCLPKKSVAAIDNEETIERMKKYVDELQAADKTALIYALGLAKYYQPVVHRPLVIEASSKFGDLDIEHLRQKSEDVMLSHIFHSDSLEHECLEVICENADKMKMSELIDCVNVRTGSRFEKAKDIEELMEKLDVVAERITNELSLPATAVFIMEGSDLKLCIAFDKSDTTEMLNRKNARVTAAKKPKAMENIAPISLSVKKEIEALAKWKSLNGVKMSEIKKASPSLAKFISNAMADFRYGKSCGWSLATLFKKPMKNLIEACWGMDAAAYYEHCKATVHASYVPKLGSLIRKPEGKKSILKSNSLIEFNEEMANLPVINEEELFGKSDWYITDSFLSAPPADIFIIKTEEGDDILVDTQGYDYVRYAVKINTDIPEKAEAKTNLELSSELENVIKKHFPESYIHVSTKGPLSDGDVWVTFALGANKDHWPNGIIQNDMLFHQFFIEGFNAEGESAKKIKGEMLVGGSARKNGSPIKDFRWVNNSMAAESLVKKFDKYFAEMKAFVDNNPQAEEK